MESDLTTELELQADDRGDERGIDVTCVRPRPRRFECRAYVRLRDGVAAMATYDVQVSEPEADTNETTARRWTARARAGSSEDLPVMISGELLT
jgi:hypothetical protein